MPSRRDQKEVFKTLRVRLGYAHRFMKPIVLSLGFLVAALTLLCAINQTFAQNQPGSGKSAFEQNSIPSSAETVPDGWRTAAPRDEIRPHFSFQAQGGPQ